MYVYCLYNSYSVLATHFWNSFHAVRSKPTVRTLVLWIKFELYTDFVNEYFKTGVISFRSTWSHMFVGIHVAPSFGVLFIFISITLVSIYFFRDCDFSYTVNHIGGVVDSVLALSAVDRGFEPRSGHTRDYEIGICCFSAKRAALRKKSKDWLTRIQDNVSEWGDMSVYGLVFQWTSTITIQLSLWTSSSFYLKLTCRHDIAGKLELALNSNHSFTVL